MAKYDYLAHYDRASAIRVVGAGTKVEAGSWEKAEALPADAAQEFIRFTLMQLEELYRLPLGKKLLEEINNSGKRVIIFLIMLLNLRNTVLLRRSTMPRLT